MPGESFGVRVVVRVRGESSSSSALSGPLPAIANAIEIDAENNTVLLRQQQQGAVPLSLSSPRHAVHRAPRVRSTTPMLVAQQAAAGRTGPDKILKRYRFHRIFSADSTQGDFFDAEAKGLIRGSVLEGVNTSMLAYGATGSGKTYTVMGSQPNEVTDGLLPRALREAFDTMLATTDRVFCCALTFVELYKDDLHDLLAGRQGVDPITKRRVPVHIHFDKDYGVYLSGSEGLCCGVRSLEDALRLVQIGLAQRAVGRTNLNRHSSRSHIIVTLHVQSRKLRSKARGGEALATHHHRVTTDPHVFSRSDDFYGPIRVAKMNIVDLAGSEDLRMSESMDGNHRAEVCKINLSLTTLAQVIMKLSEPASRRGKVPYRSSKLTALLSDSLGGNSKTLLVVHVRPSMAHHTLTHMSLEFASRAKKIRNSVTANLHHSVNAKLEERDRQLQSAADERDGYRRRLEAAAERDRRHMKENMELRAQLQERDDGLAHQRANRSNAWGPDAGGNRPTTTGTTTGTSRRQQLLLQQKHLLETENAELRDAADALAARASRAESALGVKSRDLQNLGNFVTDHLGGHRVTTRAHAAFGGPDALITSTGEEFAVPTEPGVVPVDAVEDMMVRSIKELADRLAATENDDEQTAREAASRGGRPDAGDISSICFDPAGDEHSSSAVVENAYVGHDDDYTTDAAADEHGRLFKRLSRTLGVPRDDDDDGGGEAVAAAVAETRENLMQELASIDESMADMETAWDARGRQLEREHAEQQRQLSDAVETARLAARSWEQRQQQR